MYVTVAGFSNGDLIVPDTSDASSAELFTLNSACNLVLADGEIANLNGDANEGGIFYFNTADEIRLEGYLPFTCLVTDSILSCTARLASTFAVCSMFSSPSDVVWIEDPAVAFPTDGGSVMATQPCVAITFHAFAVS